MEWLLLLFFFGAFGLIASGNGSPNDIIFPFRPQPRQSEAAKAMSPFYSKKVIGFGGPKFGGKSWTIQYIAALLAMSRPMRVLIVGHKFEDMKTLHIAPLESWLDDYIQAGLVKPYNATNKMIEIPRWNSAIKFQQVTRDADARSLNGQGWDVILVDEAQKLTPWSLSFIQGVNRISPTQSRHRSKLRTLFRNAKKDFKEDLRKHANKRIITDGRADTIIDYALGKISSKELPIKKGQADMLIAQSNQFLARMKSLQELWDNTYYKPKILYCFNWGEKGHTWLKRRFWDGCSHKADPVVNNEGFARDPDTGKLTEFPEDYEFVFAPLEDNKIGNQENPEYVRKLKQYPEPYRTAYLTGDPNVFSGMMFEITPHIHEIDFDAYLKVKGFVHELEGREFSYIPEHWALYACIDAGVHCSAGFYAKAPDGTSIQIADYNGDGLDPLAHINEMVAEWLRCPWTRGRLPDIVFSDKYGFAKHGKNALHSHDITWEDLFWEHHRLALFKIDEDRVTSAMALRQALAYDMGEDGSPDRKPTLLFAKRNLGTKDANGYTQYKRICEYTIEEIVSLEPDDKRPDDWAHGPGIEDHAADKTKNYVLGASSPAALPSKPDPHYSKKDYGRQSENFERIEDAEYEDISVFGSGGISEF